MAHLSPSTIFSPSVARQHLAISKDWNHIDAWLAAKYSPKAVPPIERTPETLKFLLQLSSLNETVDEQQDLHHLSTLSAISTLKSANQTPNTFLEDTSQNLNREGETALEALATLSQLLNVQDGDTVKMARKIVDLQKQEFDIDQTSRRLEILSNYLSTELLALNTTISGLESPTYQVSPTLISQTQEYTRKAKALTASLPEMRDRVKAAENIAAVDGGGKYPTIQEIVEEERSFKELMSEVRELEGDVRSFHGLPHDTDLARLEVEGLRVDLRDLIRKRDAMFEGLVERETPRKGR